MSECQKKRKILVPPKIFEKLASRTAFYFTVPRDVSLSPQEEQEEIKLLNAVIESQESLVARVITSTNFGSIEEMLARLGNQMFYLGLGPTKKEVLDYYAELDQKYRARMQQHGITLYAIHVISKEAENAG